METMLSVLASLANKLTQLRVRKSLKPVGGGREGQNKQAKARVAPCEPCQRKLVEKRANIEINVGGAINSKVYTNIGFIYICMI